MKTVQDYIATMTADQKAEYQRIYGIIKHLIPQAEPVISYGIIGFDYKGKRFLYFGAFKDHMSLYPASDEMIAEVGEGLDKFRAAKGTLRFNNNNLMSDQMLTKIVEYKIRELSLG